MKMSSSPRAYNSGARDGFPRWVPFPMEKIARVAQAKHKYDRMLRCALRSKTHARKAAPQPRVYRPRRPREVDDRRPDPLRHWEHRPPRAREPQEARRADGQGHVRVRLRHGPGEGRARARLDDRRRAQAL